MKTALLIVAVAGMALSGCVSPATWRYYAGVNAGIKARQKSTSCKVRGFTRHYRAGFVNGWNIEDILEVRK